MARRFLWGRPFPSNHRQIPTAAETWPSTERSSLKRKGVSEGDGAMTVIHVDYKDCDLTYVQPSATDQCSINVSPKSAQRIAQLGGDVVVTDPSSLGNALEKAKQLIDALD
jgi:hypothetical protein